MGRIPLYIVLMASCSASAMAQSYYQTYPEQAAPSQAQTIGSPNYAPQPVYQPYGRQAPAYRQQAMPAQPVPQWTPPMHTQPSEAGPRRWYAGLRAELNFVDDLSSLEQVNATESERTTIEYNPSIGASVFAGYRVTSYLRAEAEFTYRGVGVDTATAQQIIGGSVVGTTDLKETIDTEDGEDIDDEYGFDMMVPMLNAYIDIPLSDSIYVDPYIGGGVGWAFRREGEDENGFAWQAMTGIGLPLNGGRSVISLGYRYFQAPDIIDGFDSEAHIVDFSFRETF